MFKFRFWVQLCANIILDKAFFAVKARLGSRMRAIRVISAISGQPAKSRKDQIPNDNLCFLLRACWEISLGEKPVIQK